VVKVMRDPGVQTRLLNILRDVLVGGCPAEGITR
jgi:hypothetical protein